MMEDFHENNQPLLIFSKLFSRKKLYHIWDKVFKTELGQFCARQPLKNLKNSGLLKQIISI